MTDKAARRRKKLLVLTSTFPRWEQDCEPPFVFELCRRLTEDFEVHVLAPHAVGASIRERLGGLEVHRFRYFFGKWEALAYQGGIIANLKRNHAFYLLVPFFLFFQLVAIRRLLKHEKIDIVHAHWLIPQGLVAIVCRLLSGKRFPALLCTSHGTDLLGLQGRFFTIVKQQVMHRADAVTVVSHAMKAHALMLGAVEEKLSVIPMGIDAACLFTPVPQVERNAMELLFVGRLVASKAVDSLIKAMPAILSAQPEARLSIAGDGPEKIRLMALANDAGIGDKVRFLGTVANPDLPALYRRAAIFVSPSLSEGFGLTLAEALACECAVIASNLPAVREIVQDGETGLLVPPANTDEIARAALVLLADPSRCETLGRTGRKYVLRRFDWQVTAANYASLLHKLTAEQQP